MKKSFLIAALFLGTIVAQAQTTPPAATPAKPPAAGKPVEQKPQFQPEWTKRIVFQVDVNMGQAMNYINVVNAGGPQAITVSDKFTGNQITLLLRDYNTVIDSLSVGLSKKADAALKTQQAKFTADTTAKYHPVKKQ